MRWADYEVVWPLTQGFRGAEGLPMFTGRMRVFPDASADLKALAQEQLTWLDGQIAGRDYIAGDTFTLADILLFCFVAFGEQVGQPLNRDLKNLSAWNDRIAARPSAKV